MPAAGRGIVLFAHGSRDARWREPVEAVARRIVELDPSAQVRCAYLELAAPDLAGAVDALAQGGATAIDIVPLFLGVGKHLREDLPRLFGRLQETHPAVVFTLRLPVGETAEVIDLLARISLQK